MDEPRYPRPERPDAGTALVSEWIVGTGDRQAAAVDALHAGWAALATTPGFLSLSSFASLDGERVLNYAQWTDDDAHREFTRVDRPDLVAAVDAAVPGIDRPGVQRYRLYRSLGLGSNRRVGCVVAIQFDTDSTETAERLVDAVVSRQAASVPGGCHAHFHVRKDGGRMFNLAGFVDAGSHGAALHSTAMDGPDGIRAAIAALPGVETLGYKRYELRRSLTNPDADQPSGR